jgi:hypothetical protein
MTETAEFLRLRRAAVLDDALANLDRAAPRRYGSAGTGEMRKRLEALFDRLLEASASRDLLPALAYAEAIAEERFNAGYDLAEIQAAVNALETAAWTTIFAELEPARYWEALGLVSTILGAVKDALARRYVSLTVHAHTPSLDLRALFAGTERLTVQTGQHQ